MKKHLFALHVLMAAASFGGDGGGGFAASDSGTAETPPAGDPAGQVDGDPTFNAAPDAALVVASAADPVAVPVAPVALASDAEFAQDAGAGTAQPGEVTDPAAYAEAVEAGVVTPIPGTTGPSPFRRPEAPAPTVLPVDEFHGRGGDFVIGEDGIRRPADSATPSA